MYLTIRYKDGTHKHINVAGWCDLGYQVACESESKDIVSIEVINAPERLVRLEDLIEKIWDIAGDAISAPGEKYTVEDCMKDFAKIVNLIDDLDDELETFK